MMELPKYKPSRVTAPLALPSKAIFQLPQQEESDDKLLKKHPYLKEVIEFTLSLRKFIDEYDTLSQSGEVFKKDKYRDFHTYREQGKKYHEVMEKVRANLNPFKTDLEKRKKPTDNDPIVGVNAMMAHYLLTLTIAVKELNSWVFAHDIDSMKGLINSNLFHKQMEDLFDDINDYGYQGSLDLIVALGKAVKENYDCRQDIMNQLSNDKSDK